MTNSICRTRMNRTLAAPKRLPRAYSVGPLVLVTLGALVHAGPVSGQGTPLAPGNQAPPGSPQALMAEYQQVEAQLGQLQVQVIQGDAELQTRRSAIDEMVLAAMVEINPESQAQIDRLSELSEEATVAQQAQDNESMQSIMNEAMTIRSALDAAQSEAIRREDVRSEIQSFEEVLMEKVVEIDPEARELVIRLEELAAELTDAGPPGGS